MTATPFEGTYKILTKKILIRLRDRVCDTSEELLASELFFEIIKRCVQSLARRHSLLFGIFGRKPLNDETIRLLIQTMQFLVKMPADLVPKVVNGSDEFLADKELFNDFIEYLYNYWRSFDRFLICDSAGAEFDKRPFRTFTNTIEDLTCLVRKTYRDIQENVTGTHPWIYRQVSAGAEMAMIALPKAIAWPAPVYEKLNAVSVIRQVLFYPPLVLNSPMNKREGRFERIAANPLEWIGLNPDEWLCYPAKVGSLLVLVYFSEKFFELGLALANLFELADNEDLKKKPDAVYVFGVPGGALDRAGALPTVFYDDESHGILVGAVPDDDRFGYFGYLKKMILTLHNIKKMKAGSLPFHGAFVKVFLKGNRHANLLMIGDTGAGKSETLEALRQMAAEEIQDMAVIADDMGSLELTASGDVIGYGTEIGAFLRLDDLQPGYALGQIDRAIIMNATQVNARIVLPVTTFANVIRGHEVDFVLYANNYEVIDEDHPIVERFETSQEAIKTFREGTVMSKGTTTATGLVHSYFANIFGPAQYKALHDTVAKKFFDAFFEKGLFVGQMRTRLGIPGWERKGPEESARELLRIIKENNR